VLSQRHSTAGGAHPGLCCAVERMATYGHFLMMA
jgi:hypothetical protein